VSAAAEAEATEEDRGVPTPVICAVVIWMIAGVIAVGVGLVGLVGQTRTLLFAAFLLVFAALVPAAAALTASSALTRLEPVRLRAAAVLGAAALVLTIGVLRVADLLGADADLSAVMTIAGGAAVVVVTALVAGLLPVRPAAPPPPWVRHAAALTWSERLPGIAVAGALFTLIAFTPEDVTPLAVAAALVVAGAAALIAMRHRWAPAGGGVGLALDAAVLAVVALLVIDIGGYWGEGIAAVDSPTPFFTTESVSAQLHQHFFLGPVNDVLHGRALLVDANSVYGIGNTYVLALIFTVLPLNYGTFTLVGGVMTLLMLALGWWIARRAGVVRPAAALLVLVATLIGVLDPFFPPTLYSNLGGFRFGPPFALLAVALLVHRDGAAISRSPWVVATFAVFSTWSLESITYCSGAYLGLLLIDVARADGIRRAGTELLRSVGALLAGCLVVHAVFALVTLAFAGSLPDWTDYIALFRAWSDIISFAFGSYGLEAWSRGLLLGGLYAGSIVAVVAITRRGSTWMPAKTVVAVAGLSGTGIAFLTYFLAHSRDVYLLYVCLPALIVGAIWLCAAARAGSAPWRAAAVGIGTFVAALLVAGGWDDGRDRFSRTALAHLLPGGPSLSEDLDYLWDAPPVKPAAEGAVALLDANFPDDRAIVLTEPDLGQEALLRSGRANGLPISYPWQDEVYLDRSLPPVERAVDELELGERLLLQDPPAPDEPPTAQQAFGNVPIGERLGPLAQAALDRIEEDWVLRRIDEGPDGLYVAELVRRR
jgi:hypothetical protein